jgi:hypothetical protein
MLKVGRLLARRDEAATPPSERKPRKAPPPGKAGKAGRPAAPAPSSRRSKIIAAKLLRTQGRTIPWRPAAIYGAIVIVMGIGLGLWDHAYEVHQAALLTPPPPQVLAKNLVEDVVGQGTVRAVAADPKAGTLDLTVQDVLLKPGERSAEMHKDLTAEGTLAIQIVQSRLPGFKTVTVHLVDKAGKSLATVRMQPGQRTPAAEFTGGAR